MNSKTQAAVLSIVKNAAVSRRFRVATLYTTPCTVPLELAKNGHKVVVLGDLFKQLYNLKKQGTKLGTRELLIVESSLAELPIKNNLLDSVVLCNNLPGQESETELKMLRDLLKPGGMIVWPHPTSVSLGSKLQQTMSSKASKLAGNTSWHNYTSLLMNAGFQNIGQIAVPSRTSPWTVTTGYASARPWTNLKS